MKRKLTAILLAASMVFCLALTGCSNPAPGGSDSGDAAPNGAASANYKAAKDSYKIGFVSWSIGHTVPAAWDEGIHTALDGFPQYEYTAFDGEASAETQIRIMSDLISQGYDAIILQASDGAALTNSVEEAEAAGIPVVCLNLDVNCNHTGFVSRYFNGDGYYPEPGAVQSESSPYRPWFQFRHWPDQYESWWGIYTLPAVEESCPGYREFIFGDENSVVRRWLRAGADGWRLDVADELPDDFVAGIHTAARAEKGPCSSARCGRTVPPRSPMGSGESTSWAATATG